METLEQHAGVNLELIACVCDCLCVRVCVTNLLMKYNKKLRVR